jgi:hypothetical protein
MPNSSAFSSEWPSEFSIFLEAGRLADSGFPLGIAVSSAIEPLEGAQHD